MAPPSWTALTEATGAPQYLAFSDAEYWATADFLYRDIPETGGGLFLRDSRFFDEPDANGNLVFWARGNGWVFSGLTAVLDALPATHPNRPRCAPACMPLQLGLLWLDGCPRRATCDAPKPPAVRSGLHVPREACGLASTCARRHGLDARDTLLCVR